MAERTASHHPKDGRRRLILDAARERADAAGWAAVTTRHLAEAIGYTQPVLYSHFPGGKSQIMVAVALEGFTELTRRGRSALGRKRGRRAIEAVATSYLEFGAEHPAVYEAMFQHAIDIRFADDNTDPALRAGFTLLRDTLGPAGDEAATEVLWAALHGISLLERAGRVRPDHRRERVAELGRRFAQLSTDGRTS